MKGKILDYNIQDSSGVISGEDGKRYAFSNSEWKNNVAPKSNQSVDFEVEGDTAKSIYLVSSSGAAGGGTSSKLIAGLLAIFIGCLGVHKFYIGCTTAGIVMLVVFLFGFILLGLPSLIIAVIAFIEGLIYLFKSDDDFEQIYINNKKCWF